MAHESDCKSYCLNLEYLPREGRHLENGENRWGSGYYCTLTNRKCVGAKFPFFRSLVFVEVNDIMNPAVVERCPSRKTIDDTLKTQTQ